MLKANFTQRDENNKSVQIIISIDALAYCFHEATTFVDIDQLYFNPEEIYNTYAGELPWRDNSNVPSPEIVDENYDIFGLTNIYSFHSWSSMRTKTSKSFPILNRNLALFLELNFNPEDLSYYSNDEKVTKYIYSEYSSYYYIKKSFLKRYLQKSNYGLVHHKLITKYGELGVYHDSRTLNPSYRNIVSNDVFDFTD